MVPDRQALSADGPSIAVVGQRLYAVWRGADNAHLYWSQRDDLGKCSWSLPAEIDFAYTNTRPSIVAVDTKLVALWKAHDGEALYYSVRDCSTKGNSKWTSPKMTKFGSKTGPALAFWDTDSKDHKRVWAAWNGTAQDELFWRAWFSENDWGEQYPDYIDVTTNMRPAMASCHGRLYLAWTSSAPGSEQQIWVSYLEEGAEFWAPPFCVERHCHSDAAPSLATFNGRIYAAWRGKGNDSGIWLAPCDHPADADHLERPQRLGEMSTSSTPAFVEWKSKLVFVWKGGFGGDTRIWWGYGDFC